MEEEVARRAALATKGVRQNKSKGTPAALRKRSEAFAQKTIVHKGVAKSSVRARASSSSGGNGGGAAFSREIAAAGSLALVGDVRVGLAAHPRPPPRARAALPLCALGGAPAPTAVLPARHPLPFGPCRPARAQKEEESGAKISPWIIGGVLFILIGSTIAQVLSANKLVG